MLIQKLHHGNTSTKVFLLPSRDGDTKSRHFVPPSHHFLTKILHDMRAFNNRQHIPTKTHVKFVNQAVKTVKKTRRYVTASPPRVILFCRYVLDEPFVNILPKYYMPKTRFK